MSNMRGYEVAAVLIVSWLFSSGNAAVLMVPGGYVSIQKAIDSSSNGDVVIVSPGTYNENIKFKGKAIKVSSLNPNDPAVVGSTIIKAVGQNSTVTFASGEGQNSVLTGLTISGGYGTINASFGSTIYWGGGIYCYNSSPTIASNIITANNAPADASKAGYGCGIGCISSNALITRNTITANSGYAGGGILIYLGNVRIASNLISANDAVIGGGIVLLYGGNLLNNTIVNNIADTIGNVYAVSDISIGQCLVSDNIICDAANGGGLYLGSQKDIDNTAYNDVWNNAGGNYIETVDQTGFNYNISQDPLFVDDENNNYHIQYDSPCVNAGDPNYLPAAGESDFYGEPRIFAGRVDIGADEYSDNFRPLAEAGADQLIRPISFPVTVTLDGSGSSDPNGHTLNYQWQQIGGPAVSLNDTSMAKPSFSAPEVGTYVFELIVNDGQFSSIPDTVQVVVRNDPPTANAGDDQTYANLPASITLDGSKSFDPENAPLSYHWRQVSGWKVELSDANAVSPTFMRPWPGTYVFELVVNDGLQDSKPDVVGIVIGDNHAPVADAGPSRYIVGGSIALDGRGSYDPDGYGDLAYQWRQTSGATISITGANSSTPLLSSFATSSTIKKYTFELVVSDGDLTSQPSSVTVTIVPNFGTNAIQLTNPPFDPARPTIVAFGGGNCSTGSGMTFGGTWNEKANWITVDSYSPSYSKYGDMLIVYLSSVAPYYAQPIQTTGFSTGNMPAMAVARYTNVTYRDPRYAVNRVSLLDAVCSNLSSSVAQFHANPIGGEQCWVDSYISNDPQYAKASVLSGALNTVCNPYRSHSYPVNRYISSSLEYVNGGLTAFGYLSVIGDGKNYQLNTASEKYYFMINSGEDIVFYNQSLYPGKILAPVTLIGPADGNTIDANGAVFSCGTTENAVGYQLLFGSNPDRVMDYTIISDTPNPPNQIIAKLPFDQTWWTVRAYDQYGSTIYADPRLIKLPENRPPVAKAGPDQIIYAGLDGKAQVTLNGSNSSDADGDTLNYKWAWAVDANIYEANDMSLTIELPIGVYTFQLMVNDGSLDSQPDEVNITVVAPIEETLKITPTTINRKSNQPDIKASITLPSNITQNDIDLNEPLILYPGGITATSQKILPAGNGNQGLNEIAASFDKTTLMNAVSADGNIELKIAGKLKSGRYFYGSDTVRIIR